MALSYKILPPEITKMWEIAILGVLWVPGNKCRIQWFFRILWVSESFSLYLSFKNSFNFKLRFFTYFEYILGVSSEKTFYIQITIVPGNTDAKKTRKTFHRLRKIFSQCLIMISSLLWAFMVQNFCKNLFSEGKSKQNGIPIIKITFFVKDTPELQVSIS